MNSHRSNARAMQATNPLEWFFSPQSEHQLVATAAYYRAERRGFAPGHEVDDWLAAEQDVNLACGWLKRERPAI